MLVISMSTAISNRRILKPQSLTRILYYRQLIDFTFEGGGYYDCLKLNLLMNVLIEHEN
jgi:hypothetical protein